MSPSEIGAVAEAEVARALRLAGIDVYVPLFNPHARVDLVIDGGDGLQRVQCKTSLLTGAVLSFRTCSNTGNVPRDDRGQVDLFQVGERPRAPAGDPGAHQMTMFTRRPGTLGPIR